MAVDGRVPSSHLLICQPPAAPLGGHVTCIHMSRISFRGSESSPCPNSPTNSNPCRLLTQRFFNPNVYLFPQESLHYKSWMSTVGKRWIGLFGPHGPRRERIQEPLQQCLPRRQWISLKHLLGGWFSHSTRTGESLAT